MRQVAPLTKHKFPMNYLPTFRLSFPDGQLSEYRLNHNQVEFLTSDGSWRILGAEDIRLHYVLHTEVAKWLMRTFGNARRTGTT